MIHLEFHNHAFLDKDNKVMLLAVFEKWAHNHQLLEDIRISNNAEKVICCCAFGIGNIGDIWNEVSKSWIRPIIEIPFDYFEL